MTEHQCPACGDDALTEQRQHATFEFEGRTLGYCSLYTLCRSCGLEFANAEQAKANKRSVVAARATELGIPSTVALRNWRKKWGLNQKQAGDLLGVGPTAFSKYENDELVPSAPTARLLFLVTQSDIAVQKLAARYDVALPVDAFEASATVTHEPSASEERVSERIKQLATAPDAIARTGRQAPWGEVAQKVRSSDPRRKKYEITPERLGL